MILLSFSHNLITRYIGRLSNVTFREDVRKNVAEVEKGRRKDTSERTINYFKQVFKSWNTSPNHCMAYLWREKMALSSSIFLKYLAKNLEICANINQISKSHIVFKTSSFQKLFFSWEQLKWRDCTTFTKTTSSSLATPQLHTWQLPKKIDIVDAEEVCHYLAMKDKKTLTVQLYFLLQALWVTLSQSDRHVENYTTKEQSQ